jgi:hypothetical protein
MRAPVYRFVDARNTFFGLAFPGEVVVFLCVVWPSLLALAPSIAAVAIGAAYLAIRLLNRGRPDGFLQHWAWWRVRQLVASGSLSASARSRTAHFPLSPSEHRDVPPRGRHV